MSPTWLRPLRALLTNVAIKWWDVKQLIILSLAPLFEKTHLKLLA